MRQTEESTNCPREISDNETFARAIFSPFHVTKRGRIKKEAFKPPAERADLSINRMRILSFDACKLLSIAMQNEQKNFRGFATLTAADARSQDLDIIDSREIYYGHADIIFPITLTKGEPAPAEYNIALQMLVDLANYTKDPFPGEDYWSATTAP